MSARTCGSCTLCCKLFPVPELEKPAGRWCRHIAQGRGCGIHETRPDVCRAFWCQWIENLDLGPEWKPEVCKFVLSIYPGSNSLAVTVDPATPASWRREPYLTGLRRFAAAALAQGDQVIVFVGDRATAMLPEGEAELGRILPGDRIATLRRGSEYAVEVRRSSSFSQEGEGGLRVNEVRKRVLAAANSQPTLSRPASAGHPLPDRERER